MGTHDPPPELVALATIDLPDSATLTGLNLSTATTGADTLRASYRAPAPLSPDAEQMLASQLRRVFGAEQLGVTVEHLGPSTDVETDAGADQAE